MARLPRISPIGMPVHLIQRGNNRQTCFAAPEDYSAYLNWLKEYAIKFSVDVHAWILMTNHVHLLCTPQAEGAISQLMQSVGGAMFSISIINISVVEPYGKGDTDPA